MKKCEKAFLVHCHLKLFMLLCVPNSDFCSFVSCAHFISCGRRSPEFFPQIVRVWGRRTSATTVWSWRKTSVNFNLIYLQSMVGACLHIHSLRSIGYLSSVFFYGTFLFNVCMFNLQWKASNPQGQLSDAVHSQFVHMCDLMSEDTETNCARMTHTTCW